MLSVTDDSLYKEVGFDEGTPKFDLGVSTKLYTTFKVINDTGATEDIKAKTVNSKIKRGYLTVWAIADNDTKKMEDVSAGAYTLTPYFVTKDGVKVTSAVKRTVTIGEKKSYSDFDASNDQKVTSTIKSAE